MPRVLQTGRPKVSKSLGNQVTGTYPQVNVVLVLPLGWPMGHTKQVLEPLLAAVVDGAATDPVTSAPSTMVRYMMRMAVGAECVKEELPVCEEFGGKQSEEQRA
jgi:hypothetical protein